MIRFKQFLIERNIHQIHLEQNALMGVKEIRNAITMIRELRDTLRGTSKTKNVDVTVKWDGAPAIFAGTNPENGKFFVSTKSFFNKESLAVYEPSDVKKFSEGIQGKMLDAFKYFKKLNIKGILQGDLLYTKKDLKKETIDGIPHFVFRPNTITYAVPVDSDFGKQIAASKIGIVFHTKYTGKTPATMSSAHDIDISPLTKTKDVFFTDAYISDYSGTVTFSKNEDDRVTKLLKFILSDFRNIKRSTFEGLKTKKIFPIMEIYNNKLVREGKVAEEPKSYLKDFEKFYIDYVKTKRIAKLKSEKGKAKAQAEMDDALKWFKEMKSEIGSMIGIYTKLHLIKMMFVRKFEEIQGKVKSFIQTDDGFRATKPEGFVAIHHGNVTKLVDRLEFSRNNFNIAKNWSK